jgi:hypothetical protein
VSGKQQEENENVKIDPSLKASSGTNANSVKTEEEAINVDGLSTKEINELREKVISRRLSFINSSKILISALWLGHVILLLHELQ